MPTTGELDAEDCDAAGSDGAVIKNISDIFDEVLKRTDGRETVTMSDLMGALRERAYGPLLLLPGVIAVSPIGMIPGMSVVTGTIVLLVAGQALIGRSAPWLPARVLQFSFSRAKLASGVDAARPWVARFERLMRYRLQFMCTEVPFRIGAACCALLALTFYPLAIVPFGVTVPATAVVAFSLGWTARDGAFVIAGFALVAMTIGILAVAWPF